MPAPKVDLQKFKAHMNRNKKPKKMSSTQKSLSDISKRANEEWVCGKCNCDPCTCEGIHEDCGCEVCKSKRAQKETATPMRTLKLINKIKKSGVVKQGSMAKEDTKREKELDRYKMMRKNARGSMKKAAQSGSHSDMVKAMNTARHASRSISKINKMKTQKEDLNVSDGIGSWIKDFKKSDAPQFAGKSDKKRRTMAVAAYLNAKRKTNEARGEDAKGHKRATEKGAGLTQKGRDYYNRKTGGNLQAPVTGSVKRGSKAAKRRKSFCARMSGMPGPMKDDKGRPTRKAMSLRRWKC